MDLSCTTEYVAALKHSKACTGVRNHFRTNVGVRIDPRTCLTLVFLGPVSKVKAHFGVCKLTIIDSLLLMSFFPFPR